jgi:hypothetical protein
MARLPGVLQADTVTKATVFHPREHNNLATFTVSVLAQDEIHALPGTWDGAAFKRVLELADADDIGEIAEGDLEDICLMTLQDLGNHRAGEVVLEAVFGESMRAGVRQNLVDDLQEDQPWDDFADVTKQRGIFIAVCLLQKAFPARYGTPDASRVRVQIQAQTDAGLAAIDPQKSAWLVRLLACGLDHNNFVHRLYEDELKSGPFAEAAGLIWEAVLLDDPDTPELARMIRVTGSSQLFGALFKGQQFKAVV